MKKVNLSFDEFVLEVNRLDKLEIDKINKSNPIFKAVSYGFDSNFLKIYFDEGLTPEKALNSINEERGI